MNEPLSKNLESFSRDFAVACFSAFSCSLVSLSLELVLAKIALVSLGSTAMASTITITIYLFGLTFGALWAQNCQHRGSLLKAAATMLVAAPMLFIALMGFLNSNTLSSHLVLLLLTLALLLPSTSSAALVSLLATRQKTQLSNYVYLAANLGAFAGALATGFFILPTLGLSGSLLTLAILMAPTAIFSWLSQDKAKDQIEDQTADQVDDSSLLLTAPSKSAYLILFATALVMTVLECAWLRLSSLLLGSASLTFAGTLAAIIAGLAIGNFAAIKLSKNKSDLKILPAAALTLTTLACLLSLKSIAALPIIFQNLRIFFQLGQFENSNFLALPQLLATAVLVVPTCVGLGLIYPIYTSGLSGPAWRRAYTISAAGAIAGPALFLVILPLCSLVVVVKLCIAILALFTITEALSVRKRFKALSLACSFGAIFALALITISPGIKSSTRTAGLAYLPATKAALEQIKNEQKYLDFRFYRDGMNSTISVEESKLANIRILKSDGKVEATIPIAKSEAASGSDLATQTMLCLLPTLMHGGSDLRCLIIGLGSGTTSSTASEKEQIRTIDVVEIEPAVVEAAKYFQSQLPAKLNIIQSDARAHLKSAGAYDLIISQPSEPWVAGSSALFTVEFFRLMRQKLTQEGLATQWLQLYGFSNREFLCALKTFTTVFPDTLIFHQKGAGEILLVGANSPKSLAQIDSSAYKKAFLSDSGRAAMARAGIDSWETFRNDHLFVLSKEKPLSESLPANLTGISINSDDNLLLEYSSGRYLANKEGASEKQLAANLAILENKKNNATIASFSPDNLPSPVALDQALALDPSAYLLLNLKGKRLLQENQAELALHYLNRSKSLNPSIEETRELLALALTYLGKVEEGLQETQAAHLINNKSPMPYLIAACIYQIEGNGAEARLNLNKAKQNCPENEILNQIAALQFNATGTLKSLLIRLSLAL